MPDRDIDLPNESGRVSKRIRDENRWRSDLGAEMQRKQPGDVIGRSISNDAARERKAWPGGGDIPLDREGKRDPRLKNRRKRSRGKSR